MNLDIRISVGFFAHPKTVKLVRRIGKPARDAIICLWSWVASEHPDGDITGMDAEDIAIAADWDGDPDAFLAALIDLRWIDRGEDGQLKIHNWIMRNPYAAGAEARIERARKGGYAKHAKQKQAQASNEESCSNLLQAEQAELSIAPEPEPEPNTPLPPRGDAPEKKPRRTRSVEIEPENAEFFEAHIKHALPWRSGSTWPVALERFNAIVKNGRATREHLLAQVQAYDKSLEAAGGDARHYTMRCEVFFGEEKGWRSDWTIPDTPNGHHDPPRTLDELRQDQEAAAQRQRDAIAKMREQPEVKEVQSA